jgi:hypothetical protein
MTWQMTADEIVCGRETKYNKWTPADDYIHPGDVQDDEKVTTAVREIWGTTGSQPSAQQAAISSAVAYSRHSVGTQRETATGQDIPRKDASCREQFVTPEVDHAPYTSQDLGGVFSDEVKYTCVVGMSLALLLILTV